MSHGNLPTANQSGLDIIDIQTQHVPFTKNTQSHQRMTSSNVMTTQKKGVTQVNYKQVERPESRTKNVREKQKQHFVQKQDDQVFTLCMNQVRRDINNNQFNKSTQKQTNIKRLKSGNKKTPNIGLQSKHE